MLVKLEINALTYREDRGKEQTGLERVWECEKVVFNYEVEKLNWHFDQAECGTKRNAANRECLCFWISFWQFL